MWNRFRSSGLWMLLRSVPALRSAVHLAIQLRQPAQREIDSEFVRPDPWHYETDPLEQDRFRRQSAMLPDQVGDALEIGCAEGLFTEVLATRCRSLTALDLSATALARAKARCPSVRFRQFHMMRDPLDGSYDLIVACGVLEYITKRGELLRVRDKIAAALKPGGYLLVESTRMESHLEAMWWAKWLPRGRWINELIAQHPELEVVNDDLTEKFAIRLLRRRGGE